MNYESMIRMFDDSPMKAAMALGYARANSSLRIKRNACSRVSMWKHTGIPKRALLKLEAIKQAGAATN